MKEMFPIRDTRDKGLTRDKRLTRDKVWETEQACLLSTKSTPLDLTVNMLEITITIKVPWRGPPYFPQENKT